MAVVKALHGLVEEHYRLQHMEVVQVVLLMVIIMVVMELQTQAVVAEGVLLLQVVLQMEVMVVQE